MKNIKWSKEFEGLPEIVKELLFSKMKNPPIKLKDMVDILGLEVRAANLPRGISGEIRPSTDTPSGFLIRVNKHENVNRQRFTVAHEIAHYLLHRNMIGNGITDDFLYRSGLSDWREAQANRLAADLLMPPSLINEFTMQAGGDNLKVDLGSFAKTFGVSEQAMEIRLGR